MFTVVGVQQECNNVMFSESSSREMSNFSSLFPCGNLFQDKTI